MADVTLNHRQPTIRIPRVPDVEPGARIALYWNGSIARNGDGVPGGDAAVDFARPLFGPEPYWLAGHPHLFGGGYGVGGYGEPGGSHNPNMGYANGPYGVGGHGVGGGWWQWSSPFLWRDGEYRIVARLRDAAGNEQEAALADMTIEVSAPPRPPSKAWLVSLADGELTAGWHHSPEFAL